MINPYPHRRKTWVNRCNLAVSENNITINKETDKIKLILNLRLTKKSNSIKKIKISKPNTKF